MFQRRHKLPVGQQVLGWLWPRSGWRRASWYLFHRLGRLPGSAYSIAGGFACGAAISFTPFVGLHFLLSALLAWIIRCNILASAIGTAVGNPWTFPFIWVGVYRFGAWLGLGTGGPEAEHLDFAALFGQMLNAVVSLNLPYLVETAWPIWWPMFVGSIPIAIAVWYAFYWPLKWTISGYQRRRILRRMKNGS